MSVHIGLGNIPCCDQAFQFPVLLGDRQGHRTGLLHNSPGVLNRNTILHARRLPDLHILHLSPYIRKIPRRLHAKPLQHILRLLIYLPGPLRRILTSFIQSVLKIRIGNRGTNRIRIRILMPDNINFPLLRHSTYPFSKVISTSFFILSHF